MKNFIRNIKEHKLIALICLAVLVVMIVIVAVAVGSSGGSDDEEESAEQKNPVYFEDTDYPTRVEIKEDGRLSVRIESKKADSLKWEVFLNPDEVPLKDNIYEENGGLYIEMLPESEGYATVVFVKSSEVSGMKCEAVRIELDVYVSSDDKGNMSFYFSDIRQKFSSAGAVDSETPYILKGNRVILPNGGDWILTTEDAPPAMYYIEYGIDEENHGYFSVKKDVSIDWTDEEYANAKLVLESESLNKKQYLDCRMGDDRTWVLSVAGG